MTWSGTLSIMANEKEGYPPSSAKEGNPPSVLRSGTMGKDRPLDRTCSRIKQDGNKCPNWKCCGGDLCMIHTPKATREKYRQRRDERAVTEEGEITVYQQDVIAMVKLRPKEFPLVAAEYVSRFNRVFARLEIELDELRSTGLEEIELARAYADILDRQATCAALVTKMMDAAARMGIDIDVPDPQQEVAALIESLGEIRFQLSGENLL